MATVIAASALTGGMAGTARAEHRPAPRDADDPQTVYEGTWTIGVKPRAEVRKPGTRNRAIAFRFVAQRSWPIRQFHCLDSLWTRESNWNHRATNSSSGAYGIPQALPAGKMAGAGYDWRWNPVTQIRWGLKYIKIRYGTPCGAWGHFQSHNWY
jgi:hypothetical protein